MTAEIMVDIVEVVVVVAMTDIDAPLLRTTGEMITGEDPDLGLTHHVIKSFQDHLEYRILNIELRLEKKVTLRK